LPSFCETLAVVTILEEFDVDFPGCFCFSLRQYNALSSSARLCGSFFLRIVVRIFPCSENFLNRFFAEFFFFCIFFRWLSSLPCFTPLEVRDAYFSPRPCCVTLPSSRIKRRKFSVLPEFAHGLIFEHLSERALLSLLSPPFTFCRSTVGISFPPSSRPPHLFAA